MAKVEHFIDFLISNGHFQDVATGTTTIEISNSSTVLVPHVVSTSLRYHLVKIYEDHCKAFDYKSLSLYSLLRVLDQCKFSQRRQIAGLDNYTDDGLEVFRILGRVLDKIGLNNEEKKQLKHSLSLAVADLKGLFRSHVSKEESTCPSHCRKFALSNPADKDLIPECDHQHNEVCKDCENVFQCLDDFYDYNVAIVKDETAKEELLYRCSYVHHGVDEAHLTMCLHTRHKKRNTRSYG